MGKVKGLLNPPYLCRRGFGNPNPSCCIPRTGGILSISGDGPSDKATALPLLSSPATILLIGFGKANPITF